MRTRREELRLTQEALAHAAGLERTYIAQIESGRRNPALENICNLAAALEVDAAELVEGLQGLTGRK